MIESERKKEKEPHFKVPIIDIFRHGETEYKELADPNFMLNPDAPGFALDAEHLDLTEEGIRNIQEAAEQLALIIDKEKEAVILVTSPQLRALSSIMIIEKVFAEHGIIMLNSTSEKRKGISKGIKNSSLGLGQISFREDLKNAGFGKIWLKAHKQYGIEHPEAKNIPPAEVHGLVATALGKELPDIFSKSHDEIASGFKRYLRHLINIEIYLQNGTKQQLAGRRLRIVLVTHEERIMEFAQQSLDLEKTVAKGQLLEINPKGIIKKDQEAEADVRLFGKRGELDLSSRIKMKFSQDGLSIGH